MASKVRTAISARAALIVLAGALLCGAPAVVPGGAAEAQQRAHAHGTAHVGIAVEGNQASLEIIAPADGIYGFEHEPRNDAERMRRRFEIARLMNTLPQVIRFDPALGCRFGTPQLEEGDAHDHDHDADEGAHAEVHVEVRVTCARALGGSELRFNLTRHFPALHTVEVQALTDQGQTGVRIVNDRGTVRL